MSVFNLLSRNSFELSSKFDILSSTSLNISVAKVILKSIMLISTNWTLSQVKIILIPDQEFFPSVVDYIKQSLELRK
jgi:hypothetical protein